MFGSSFCISRTGRVSQKKSPLALVIFGAGKFGEEVTRACY